MLGGKIWKTLNFKTEKEAHGIVAAHMSSYRTLIKERKKLK